MQKQRRKTKKQHMKEKENFRKKKTLINIINSIR